MWIDNNVWIMCSMCVDLQNAREFVFIFFIILALSFSLSNPHNHQQQHKTRFPSSNGMHAWNGTKRRSRSASKLAVKQWSESKAQQTERLLNRARWSQRAAKSAMRDSLCVLCLYDGSYFFSASPFLWAIGNGIPSLISKNVSFNTGNNN